MLLLCSVLLVIVFFFVHVFRCCVSVIFFFWLRKGKKVIFLHYVTWTTNEAFAFWRPKNFNWILFFFRRVFALVRYDSTEEAKNARAVAEQREWYIVSWENQCYFNFNFCLSLITANFSSSRWREILLHLNGTLIDIQRALLQQNLSLLMLLLLLFTKTKLENVACSNIFFSFATKAATAATAATATTSMTTKVADQRK